eukprot:1753602-Prymnesium_polylepis.1
MAARVLAVEADAALALHALRPAATGTRRARRAHAPRPIRLHVLPNRRAEPERPAHRGALTGAAPPPPSAARAGGPCHEARWRAAACSVASGSHSSGAATRSHAQRSTLRLDSTFLTARRQRT